MDEIINNRNSVAGPAAGAGKLAEYADATDADGHANDERSNVPRAATVWSGAVIAFRADDDGGWCNNTFRGPTIGQGGPGMQPWFTGNGQTLDGPTQQDGGQTAQAAGANGSPGNGGAGAAGAEAAAGDQADKKDN